MFLRSLEAIIAATRTSWGKSSISLDGCAEAGTLAELV
jgi:hypothetical protein